ncbi:MAG TPA: ATP synthase F1 subunit epsilon [Gemmataceae bacterium]|nr:ATP synthase F1 subunit epsilon [Gemmataceae bacterium]
METASSKSIKCVVVTPERAVLDQAVDFVAVTMYDGELGVLPGRAPLIGKLGFGELRTTAAGKTSRFFIDGGFVQVRSDVVTVLTPHAIPAAEIKLEAAEKALQAALAPGQTPEAQENQFKAQQRARAQIRIAHHLDGKESHYG